jgi:glutathione S-transferase
VTVTLITIPFSHYCEKARWALDRCGIAYTEEGHLPLFHYLAVRRAGAKRTVPVIVDGEHVLTDSTDIIAWADAREPGTLLPTEPEARAEALALEDAFDLQLGPATRRWGYYHMLPRKDLDHLIVRGAPRWEARVLTWSRPLAVRMLSRSLKIDAAGAERSRQKIASTFARVADLLADGRRYLVGGRFTVADLAFAALAGPVVLPVGRPFGLPELDHVDGEARTQVDAWRASPAGQFALRMYADHRSV